MPGLLHSLFCLHKGRSLVAVPLVWEGTKSTHRARYWLGVPNGVEAFTAYTDNSGLSEKLMMYALFCPDCGARWVCYKDVYPVWKKALDKELSHQLP